MIECLRVKAHTKRPLAHNSYEDEQVSFIEARDKKFWSEDRLKGTTAYTRANLPSLTPHSVPRSVRRSRWPGMPPTYIAT